MPPDQTSASFLMSPMIPLFIIFFIFYFLVMKPQKDRQLQHKKMLADLKKNDTVVTTGGIHGTIVNVKDKTAVIRIDDNAKMEVDKEAIAVINKAGS